MKIATFTIQQRSFFSLLVIFALVIGFLPASSQPVLAASPNLVISQVYGGGGNTGAQYTHDFVELFNRGTEPVSLNDLSIQYASATGTGNFGASSTQLTELPNVTLLPGQYFLVQQAAGAGNGFPLPTPDMVDPTPIAMAAGAGKVALVTGNTSLGCNGGSTPCSAEQLARIIDLVGYGNANFFEGSGAAPTLSNTTAALRWYDGAQDTDDNAKDFVAGAPDPRNTSHGFDVAPFVVSTVPMNGAVDVDINTSITITFSEPVNVASGWFDLTCDIQGSVSALYMGVPTEFSVTPEMPLRQNDTCTFTIYAAAVTDQDGSPDPMEADYVFSFSTLAAVDVCTLPFTPIYTIQGSGMATPLAGQIVTTQGVVIGDYEGPAPALRGFYIQDHLGDEDPLTSDGIFVFNGNNDSVNLGDLVRVTGTAAEFQDQTQLSSVSSITICGSDYTIDPVDVSMPFVSLDYLERYEGMLVRFPQTLYVTEHFQLGRFGQVVMSSGGRLQQPTNVTLPGAPAQALQDANNLNRIIVDDHLNNQNPDPILFGRSGDPLSASNTLRGGDTATGIVGVMTYTWAGNAASGNAYRVRPVNALGGGVPEFQPANPRPATPEDVGGTVKVTGFNVLNYFNTFGSNCTMGVGGALTSCRGADNALEFERQAAKIVDALILMDADIVGLIEIENDGYGPDSAIQDLVNRLNAATAPGTYTLIDIDAETGQVNAAGTDAIKQGFIYKPSTVTPVGKTAALNTTSFVTGGDTDPRNRPAVAQTFMRNELGEQITVVVNHLKSKGSACDQPDQGDGQGNCTQVRTNAAIEMAEWLRNDPTGTGVQDILILGDLNSYAMEDPIMVFEEFGYTNLIREFVGPDSYSYVFDGQWGNLDHALATPSLAAKVTGVTEYHINADEPSVLDYNTNFKSAGQIQSLFAPDQYRSSDHDPVIIGIDLMQSKPMIVEGDGWILMDGRANYSFNARMHKGLEKLNGDVSFNYQSGKVRFTSNRYDYLVVDTAGTSIKLKGTGRVNNMGNYHFIIWATDGKPDLFRIRIWAGKPWAGGRRVR
jgi:uncharacterized protein